MVKYAKASRHWVATLNNPGVNANIQAVLDTLKEMKAIHYLVGEEGFSQGRTPHLQMAFCFMKAKTFKELKAKFPRAHLEQLMYSYEDAVRYCKKEGCYHEYGDMPLAYAYDIVDKEYGKALQRHKEMAEVVKAEMMSIADQERKDRNESRNSKKGVKGDVSVTSPLTPSNLFELYSSDSSLFHSLIKLALVDRDIYRRLKDINEFNEYEPFTDL